MIVLARRLLFALIVFELVVTQGFCTNAVHQEAMTQIVTKHWERLKKSNMFQGREHVPLTEHEHHAGCNHDERAKQSDTYHMYTPEARAKFGNYTSAIEPPSLKRGLVVGMNNIRIYVDSSLLSPADPASCHQVGKSIISSMAFVDPLTRVYTNNYTCTQSDVLTSDKKALIKDYVIPSVTEILKFIMSVVPEPDALILDRNFHEAMGRGDEVDGYICRDGIRIPQHLFDKGQPNTDFYLILTARPIPFEKKVLADAYPCSHRIYNDQWGTFYGRPLVGSVNFNPSSLLLEYFSLASVQDQFRFHQLVMLGLHELMHSLGFTSNLYAHFVDEFGQRYSEYGPTAQEERAHAPPARLLTSPKVLQFAKFHYSCPHMRGVELEGRDYGSHWEERVAGDEIMSPLTTRVMPLSALTLALFEDTGWYSINYGAAQRWRWGWRKGCDFVMKPCSEESWGDLYCTSKERRCNQERSSKAECNAKNDPRTDAQLYYNDGCPTLKSFAIRGFCQDLTSSLALKTNPYGETFGIDSSCFDVQTAQGSPIAPACYEIKCIVNKPSNVTQLAFKIDNAWYGCPMGASSTKDTWVEVKSPQRTLRVLCPDFRFFCENEALESWIITSGAEPLWTSIQLAVYIFMLLFAQFAWE